MTSPKRIPTRRARRLGGAVAVCLLAIAAPLVLLGGQAGAAKPKPKRESKRPNIVMVMTDDQAKSTISPEVMPNLTSKLMAQGTTFSDFTVTTPLCCPSRAAY